jgi:hypothetical protein
MIKRVVPTCRAAWVCVIFEFSARAADKNIVQYGKASIKNHATSKAVEIFEKIKK